MHGTITQSSLPVRYGPNIVLLVSSFQGNVKPVLYLHYMNSNVGLMS